MDLHLAQSNKASMHPIRLTYRSEMKTDGVLSARAVNDCEQKLILKCSWHFPKKTLSLCLKKVLHSLFQDASELKTLTSLAIFSSETYFQLGCNIHINKLLWTIKI